MRNRLLLALLLSSGLGCLHRKSGDAKAKLSSDHTLHAASDDAGPAVHGMVIFGKNQLYASHIPMFDYPHDWQALLKITLSHPTVDAAALYQSAHKAKTQELFTLMPKPFVLPSLLKGRLKSFNASLYKGNFESGGTLVLDDITVTVEEVSYSVPLAKDTAPLEGLSYLPINTGDASYLAHQISAPPNFDHIVQIEWLRSETEAKVGVKRFPGADAEANRLSVGQAFKINADGTVVETANKSDASFQVIADFYCSKGPDFFSPCSALSKQTEQKKTSAASKQRGSDLGASLEPGNLSVKWIAGSENCATNTDPAIQIHSYNKNLRILRQNRCLNPEAPFMYLLFGTQKALLIDTGATESAAEFPIAATVEQLMAQHYGAGAREKIELVVAHSHAHGDHVLGDAQFKGRPFTTLVGTGVAEVSKFFGFTQWPEQVVDFNLGQRNLKIIAMPGHQESHIVVYDAQTGLLFTGDTLYPGRLYIDNWAAYRSSIHRLFEYVQGQKVSHILGAHIEMSKTPGVDYPAGVYFQKDEHDLPLSLETLALLNSRLKAIGTKPAVDVQADFIIAP